MRTLHVITDRDRRGAQVHAVDLAEGLRAAGVEADIVALAPGRHGDLLDVDVLGNRRRGPTTLRALRRRATAYDVVVAHGSATLDACGVALAGAVPFVYRQISDPLFWASSPLRRARVALLVRRARRIVALSPAVAETFAAHYRLGRRHLTTIPNAVPARSWRVASSADRNDARSVLGLGDEVAVISLGALVPEKGVDLAIRSVAPHANAVLLVAGEGPEREALEALAVNVAPGRIRFLGPIGNPRTLLNAGDLLVLASRGGDSMPAVLIEAGLSGLPSVATPVGAIEEVVVDGETGIVVGVDALDELSRAVGQLVNDPESRRRLGSAARHHCLTRFTIDAVVPAWLAVFEDALRRERRGTAPPSVPHWPRS